MRLLETESEVDPVWPVLTRDFDTEYYFYLSWKIKKKLSQIVGLKDNFLFWPIFRLTHKIDTNLESLI